MNVIVIGAVQFTLEMLKVIDSHARVVGVITSSTKSINSDYVNLIPYCYEKQIPVFVAGDINASKTISWVKQLSADIIFCLGWSRLIKRPMLESVKMGVVGYHPAALPKNRGRHPLIWALALGLSETASTFFFMDEGADSGDILSQENIIIEDRDDATTLYQKMIDVAKLQMPIILKQLDDGNYKREKQRESNVNYWRKRGVPDGEIDWRMHAQSIHNLVRALARPYVGAHFMYDGKRYRVWRSRVTGCADLNNIEPGKVVDATSDELIIKCGDQCIALSDIQPRLMLSKGAYI